MADGTHIEWTDATVNAVNGCSVLSPGCKHCYAMKQAHRFDIRRGLTQMTSGGMVWTGEVRFSETQLLQPLRWKRPRRIFWNAHGDLFHEKVPDAWIDKVFAVCALTPQHTHQILTKRSARMRAYMSDPKTPGRIARAIVDMVVAGIAKIAEPWPVRTIGDIDDPDDVTIAWPLPNVWAGISVEDQKRADERIPDLLATPAAVRWLSCEPLLGPLDLTDISMRVVEGREAEASGLAGCDALTGVHWDAEDTIVGIYGNPDPRVDWVVAGGESGPGARPSHPDWFRSLRDQCEAAGVAFNFKQHGAWVSVSEVEGSGPHHHFPDGASVRRVGKKAAGRTLDGVQHDGYPS